MSAAAGAKRCPDVWTFGSNAPDQASDGLHLRRCNADCARKTIRFACAVRPSKEFPTQASPSSQPPRVPCPTHRPPFACPRRMDVSAGLLIHFRPYSASSRLIFPRYIRIRASALPRSIMLTTVWYVPSLSPNACWESPILSRSAFTRPQRPASAAAGLRTGGREREPLAGVTSRGARFFETAAGETSNAASSQATASSSPALTSPTPTPLSIQRSRHQPRRRPVEEASAEGRLHSLPRASRSCLDEPRDAHGTPPARQAVPLTASSLFPLRTSATKPFV